MQELPADYKLRGISAIKDFLSKIDDIPSLCKKEGFSEEHIERELETHCKVMNSVPIYTHSPLTSPPPKKEENHSNLFRCDNCRAPIFPTDVAPFKPLKNYSLCFCIDCTTHNYLLSNIWKEAAVDLLDNVPEELFSSNKEEHQDSRPKNEENDEEMSIFSLLRKLKIPNM